MKKMINKDKFGPEQVLEVWDPKLKMEGFLVIDNTALGPGKGGIRMTPNVSFASRRVSYENSLLPLYSVW